MPMTSAEVKPLHLIFPKGKYSFQPRYDLRYDTIPESCHKNAIQAIQKLESTVDVAITERSLEDDYPDGAHRL